MKPLKEHKPLLPRLKTEDYHTNRQMCPEMKQNEKDQHKLLGKQVDNAIPVQVHHSKAKDDKQQLQLVSTNPEKTALNLQTLL